VIRFSAGLVVVAIGVLIGGIATSKLLLVYVAIGLSVAALLALAIGVALKREELFGEQRQVLAPGADARAGKSSIQPNGAVDTPLARVPAATSTAFGEAFPGSGGTAHRAGQSPSDRPGALGYSGFGQTGLPAREGLAARDGSGSGGGSHYARPDAPGYGAGRAGQDATRPERYAGPFRLDRPGAPATPVAPAAATRSAAQASSAASAPPVSPVTPPPATSPPSPVPPWRERLSPPDGDPLGSAASSRAESGSRPGSGSSAPDWPSWFDRQARLARDDAPAPATPRVPAERETPSGSSPRSWISRSAQPAEADETPSTLSAPSTPSASDNRDADAATALSERDDDEADDTGAASHVTPAVAADDAGSAASATTPEAAEDKTSAAEHGASADADPALSAAAETDDAEAGELGHPADPESSSDHELSSDLVSADTASTDEADPADDTAGSGERRDDVPPVGRGSGSRQVTVVPGVPRYHNQDCILIRFMADEDMQKMTIQEAAETGCTPCRACQPAPA
jgi:hypothetical protein